MSSRATYGNGKYASYVYQYTWCSTSHKDDTTLLCYFEKLKGIKVKIYSTYENIFLEFLRFPIISIILPVYAIY